MRVETVKTFKSKRNRVSLIDTERGLLVEKVYPDSGNAAKEAGIYDLLRGHALKTPQLIKAEEGRLLLSYLQGTDFVRLLEQQEETKPDYAPWDKLVDWILAFYKATGFALTDVNLRNFLYDSESGEVFGLDFEECGPGETREMIAGLCAYILLYDPPYTSVKKQIVQHVQKYGAEILCMSAGLEERTERAVKIIQERRQKR